MGWLWNKIKPLFLESKLPKSDFFDELTEQYNVDKNSFIGLKQMFGINKEEIKDWMETYKGNMGRMCEKEMEDKIEELHKKHKNEIPLIDLINGFKDIKPEYKCCEDT